MSPPFPEPQELFLCQIPGLQPAQLLSLLAELGDAHAILAAPATILRASGVPPAAVARIVAGPRQLAQVMAGLKGLARLSITPIPLLSAAYPERLRQSTNPPLLLYTQGAWPPGQPLVAVTSYGALPAEREPVVREWLLRLPTFGITLGALGATLELVPPTGALFVVPYGLMLARQRLPPALHEAVRSNGATLLSAVPINAPPDERGMTLTEALLLALADAQLMLDTAGPIQPRVNLHFVLTFKDQPVDEQALPGKRLYPNARGVRTLARALGMHGTADVRVQQQRLL